MKNFLVIGGSSGIGKQVVAQLLADNCNVFSTYNETTIQEQNGLAIQQYNVVTDQFDDAWLPDVLDGVVYCPGTINLKPFKGFQREDFVNDFNLQVGGAVEVINKCLRRLKKSNQSSIVLFSTVAVQKGYSFHAQVAASKGAIEGLTRALAAELSPKVRVNCIAPSLTDTPLAGQLLNTEEKKEANAKRNPLKRLGTATDVANAVCFLLSEQASWVTGQVLHVDGGASKLAV